MTKTWCLRTDFWFVYLVKPLSRAGTLISLTGNGYLWGCIHTYVVYSEAGDYGDIKSPLSCKVNSNTLRPCVVVFWYDTYQVASIFFLTTACAYGLQSSTIGICAMSCDLLQSQNTSRDGWHLVYFTNILPTREWKGKEIARNSIRHFQFLCLRQPVYLATVDVSLLTVFKFWAYCLS